MDFRICGLLGYIHIKDGHAQHMTIVGCKCKEEGRLYSRDICLNKGKNTGHARLMTVGRIVGFYHPDASDRDMHDT
jgi:hypothetical protein